MHILQLTPRTPFPPDDGGKIGIASLTQKFLEYGHTVTMISLGEVESSSQYTTMTKFATGSFDQRILHHSTKNSPLRIILSLFQPTSLYMSKHYSQVLFEQACGVIKEAEQRNGRIDIVHADHTAMATLAFVVAKKLAVPYCLRLHNIEWKIWQRYAHDLSWWNPKSWYVTLQANRLRHDETIAIQNASSIFPITPIDEQFAHDLVPHKQSVLVRAGVNSDQWKPQENRTKNKYEIVLATQWSWVHNRDGAIWFIQQVLPIVRAVFPDVRLTLLGKNLTQYSELFGAENVDLVGYVESVQPYYHRATCFIAPLFVGSGVRIKILEAMAAGLPVIATKISAEGISEMSITGLTISDNPEVQAKKIIEYFYDAHKAHSDGETVREFVTREYSWEREVKKILSNFEQIIAGRT